MKNFVKDGKVITFTATSDVLSGEPVLIGNSTIGISTGTFKTGQEGEALLEGVVNIPKVTGKNWKNGDKLGINMTTDKKLTNTAGANVLLIGRAFNDTENTDEFAWVKLEGVFGNL